MKKHAWEHTCKEFTILMMHDARSWHNVVASHAMRCLFKYVTSHDHDIMMPWA